MPRAKVVDRPGTLKIAARAARSAYEPRSSFQDQRQAGLVVARPISIICKIAYPVAPTRMVSGFRAGNAWVPGEGLIGHDRTHQLIGDCARGCRGQRSPSNRPGGGALVHPDSLRQHRRATAYRRRSPPAACLGAWPRVAAARCGASPHFWRAIRPAADRMHEPGQAGSQSPLAGTEDNHCIAFEARVTIQPVPVHPHPAVTGHDWHGIGDAQRQQTLRRRGDDRRLVPPAQSSGRRRARYSPPARRASDSAPVRAMSDWHVTR